MIRFFRHYIPLSMLLLTLVEFVIFYFISDFVAAGYETPLPETSAHGSGHKPWLFAAILTLLNSTFGLYDWEWTKGLRSLLLRIAGSFLVAAVLIALGGRALATAFPVGSEYVTSMTLATLVAVLIRLLFMEWGKTEMFKKRVLVLGTGSRAAKIEELVHTGKAQGLTITGYLPLGAVHNYVPHERIIAEEGSLFEIATRRGAG